MQTMLIFIIVTLMFIASQYYILYYLRAMMQEDGLLDRVFGYTTMLDRLYGSENKWLRSLGDALGNCDMCFSFWFGVVWFFAYMIFSKLVVGMWVSDFIAEPKWWAIVLINFIWFSMVHGLIAMAGFLAVRNKN